MSTYELLEFSNKSYDGTFIRKQGASVGWGFAHQESHDNAEDFIRGVVADGYYTKGKPPIDAKLTLVTTLEV